MNIARLYRAPQVHWMSQVLFYQFISSDGIKQTA